MFSIKKELKFRLRGAERVAILGIGSTLRGDDALGFVLIEELKVLVNNAKSNLSVKLFSCGVMPENYTGEVKKFNPSHIIIVDAIDLGKESGSMHIIDAKNKSANSSFSTHRLSMNIITDYLSHYLNSQIIFIGIQVKAVEFGGNLSYKVNKSVKQVAHLIKESLLDEDEKSIDFITS
jgi:hydrogenase 3 maturation protease